MIVIGMDVHKHTSTPWPYSREVRADRRAGDRARRVAGAGLGLARPGEAMPRELKLLVDHRDDLVSERRRCQQRSRYRRASS